MPYMIGLLWASGAEPALQRQDEVVGSQIELVPSGYACASTEGEPLMVVSMHSNEPDLCGLIHARALD